MSRSRKRTPIGGNTTKPSDKPHKVRSHRHERRFVRAALEAERDVPHPNAFGNPWKGEKDGKQWFGDRHPDLMRK